jgi:uncharacterized protein YjbI with pentapeptide repeats
MTAREKALYHTTKHGSVFYNGCSRSDCGGERIRGFDDCIVHLSPEEGEQYAERLRAGQGELVISSVTVDMNFVTGWIERISESFDGLTLVPVPLKMQDAAFVGSLEFNKTQFKYGINLTKLTAYSVRMFKVNIGGELRLEEAELENELALADEYEVGDLLLPGLQAKHFGLSRGAIVHGKLDARGVSVENTHISKVEIRGEANFNEASLCSPGQSVLIAAEFKSPADFSHCKFRGETHLGSSPDLLPTRFFREAKFNHAIFGSESFGSLTMTDCVFEDVASFDNSEIYGAISFNDAKFMQTANLNELKIRDAPFMRGWMPGIDIPSAAFTMCRTQFESSFGLSADVDGTAVIDEITFSGVADGFSISATGALRLSRLTLESFNSLEVSSDEVVTVDQFHMQGGGELKVAGSRFSMTNFTCAKPVLTQSIADQQAHASKPKLTTLKGTNCDGLTLSGFDYGETRFLGAAKLDSLIITGEFTLRSTSGPRARRAVLAEEAAARASSEHWNKLAVTSSSSNDSRPGLRDLAWILRETRCDTGLEWRKCLSCKE